METLPDFFFRSSLRNSSRYLSGNSSRRPSKILSEFSSKIVLEFLPENCSTIYTGNSYGYFFGNNTKAPPRTSIKVSAERSSRNYPMNSSSRVFTFLLRFFKEWFLAVSSRIVQDSLRVLYR